MFSGSRCRPWSPPGSSQSAYGLRVGMGQNRSALRCAAPNSFELRMFTPKKKTWLQLGRRRHMLRSQELISQVDAPLKEVRNREVAFQTQIWRLPWLIITYQPRERNILREYTNYLEPNIKRTCQMLCHAKCCVQKNPIMYYHVLHSHVFLGIC